MGPNDYLTFLALHHPGMFSPPNGAPGDVLNPDIYPPPKVNKVASTPVSDVSIPLANQQGSDAKDKNAFDKLMDFFASLNGPPEKSEVSSSRSDVTNAGDKGPFGGSTGRTMGIDETPPNSVMAKGIATDQPYTYPRELQSGTPAPALEYAHPQIATGSNVTEGEQHAFGQGIGLGAILHSVHSGKSGEAGSELNQATKSGKAMTTVNKTSRSSASGVIRKEKPKGKKTPDIAERMGGWDTE